MTEQWVESSRSSENFSLLYICLDSESFHTFFIFSLGKKEKVLSRLIPIDD